MPQRFLRPGIRTSERFNSVSRNAQALYLAILTLVDDYGRYDGRPSVLHGEAFAVWNDLNPLISVNPQETAALCCALSESKLVEFYEVEGKKYLQLVQWQERARGPSKFPEPSAGIRSGTQPIPASIVLSLSHRHESSPSSFPSKDSIFEECSLRGIPKEHGEAFWNHFESVGWVNKHDQSILNWRPKLANWSVEERAKIEKGKTNGNQNGKYRNEVDRNAGTANEGRAKDYAKLRPQP